MKVTMILIVIVVLGTVLKRLLTDLEDLEIRDHPGYSIIKIGQNAQKSSGDLRRVAVSQTPLKNHQLTLLLKTLKGVKW